jgi:hypothetical protein
VICTHKQTINENKYLDMLKHYAFPQLEDRAIILFQKYEDADVVLLGCNAIWTFGKTPTFLRKILCFQP